MGRLLGCLVAGLLGVAAHAQLTIGGSIYEDRPALALREHFTPLAGVTLHLYRDGGDRVPGADDARVDTTSTSAAGVYLFRVRRGGDYWVAVDSRSIRTPAWAEQTFGPSGAICGNLDGNARATYFEGPCLGGRSAAADDASALATSEHVAGVTLRDTASDVDFAFSFDVVTNTNDTGQGSLRQFVVNANAIDGPNAMRFVPLQHAPEQREVVMGVPPRWWSVILATPLPELTDEHTTIDGTAYNFLSPTTVANVHPGRLGEAPTVKPDERPVPRQEKPDLEVIFTTAAGWVCDAECKIRSLSIHGASIAILARADARLEHLMIGAAPDGAMVTGGTAGVRAERGVTIAQHLLISSQSEAGIYVAAEARLDAERLDISRCGGPETGGGIVLLSNGSSVRSSAINANNGVGIVIGATDGSRPANGNTIDACTISSNVAGVLLSPGSSRNVITRNDIMWNRLGGITVAPYQTAAPRENRMSANRFDENGFRPIVLDVGRDEPNTLARPKDTCRRVETVPNDGISPPRIHNVRVENETVIIRGRACPGEVVEIYQSFVTSGVREKALEMPRVRKNEGGVETITTQSREIALPSIGEFNYLGVTNTAADGTFEVKFPFPALIISDRGNLPVEKETDIWAREVMPSAKPEERAFSAIAIDAGGNTSEMSVRRGVD